MIRTAFLRQILVILSLGISTWMLMMASLAFKYQLYAHASLSGALSIAAFACAYMNLRKAR